jgi:hypothetical protein
MAKASFSYEVDFDGSKVGLVNTLDLSEPTDELEEELEAELEDQLEDELVDAELDELVGALLLAELAMEPALGDEALPPHAASTSDKDSDVANVAIFPTVFILFLS